MVLVQGKFNQSGRRSEMFQKKVSTQKTETVQIRREGSLATAPPELWERIGNAEATLKFQLAASWNVV